MGSRHPDNKQDVRALAFQVVMMSANIICAIFSCICSLQYFAYNCADDNPTGTFTLTISDGWELKKDDCYAAFMSFNAVVFICILLFAVEFALRVQAHPVWWKYAFSIH